MKTKYLSTLLVTGAIALGTSPAMADSSDAPQLNFSCQVNNGVPTTVAKSADSDKTLTVFHWKEEAVSYKTTATPEQLCNDVTAKLENYSAQGYDLSQINFISTEQSGLPVICATTTTECSKMLLTLKPSKELPNIVADDMITAILDPSLQSKKTQVEGVRGIQSTSYEVNLLSLLGFNLKFLGK